MKIYQITSPGANPVELSLDIPCPDQGREDYTTMVENIGGVYICEKCGQPYSPFEGSDGWYTHSHPKNGTLGPRTQITIGESGRGRSEGVIPIIGEGPEVRAKKTDTGVVLVRGNWNDEGRCLAVINTVGAYDRGRSYGVFDAQGLQIIESGIIAFGQAGYTNSGEEVLTIVSPGATFRLNSKYASHYYSYMWDVTQGKWAVESPEERNARLALIEVAAGGGEWL